MERLDIRIIVVLTLKAHIFRRKQEAQGVYFKAQNASVRLIKVGGKDYKYG